MNTTKQDGNKQDGNYADLLPLKGAAMKTPKSFWSYQAATETPSLATAVAAGAIRADTTEAQWEAISPGMRREILRSVRP